MRSGRAETKEEMPRVRVSSSCIDTHINKPDSLWCCVKSIETVLYLKLKRKTHRKNTESTEWKHGTYLNYI